MRIFVLTLSLLLTTLHSANASDVSTNWALKAPSSIHFLTNKNTNIIEINQFKDFDATIKSGHAKLSIDLSSVDTRVQIRDERIQKHLFDVTNFSTAYFETTIPKDIFKQVLTGQPVEYNLQGNISLHGETVSVNNNVIITQNHLGSISVVSVTPMLIDANHFNLVAGINKLREIAGLKSIATTVPVMFNLTFAPSK